MKKIYIIILFSFFFPIFSQATSLFEPVQNAGIIEYSDSATLSWQNPKNPDFTKTILFKSNIPIEDYFSYEAVDGLCDKIYEGQDESFTSLGLAVNLSYYFILFTSDRFGNYSDAIVLEKNPSTQNSEEKKIVKTLVGASSDVVNEVSFDEAGIIYNYNKKVNTDPNSDSHRLALFIIVKSPHDLSDQDKNAISYFIDAGTPTTILLGAGERTGVLNSYLSVFDKLPSDQLEWQDIIKIANGRWPNQRNLESENSAANESFSAIYERKANMDDPNDNAAVTVIAYGLRPAQRNLESENNAIRIFRSIFNNDPVEAHEWDLVRAIAYSGATR